MKMIDFEMEEVEFMMKCEMRISKCEMSREGEKGTQVAWKMKISLKNE